MSKTNNFYAILNDESLRSVTLTQNVIPDIEDIFIKGGNEMLEGMDEVKFNGSYRIDEDEVLYVDLPVPDALTDAIKNPVGVLELDISRDRVKTLFWYNKGIYYYQNFDSRRLLQNRNVLFYSSNTFDKLRQDAFIVEDMVNAVHLNGKFYFKSYANANKIFSLGDFYHEATNEEIKDFGSNGKVVIDETWFTTKTNTVIRKHITLLQKSNVLSTADTKKIKKDAATFKLKVELDVDGKIIFPNDAKSCKDILSFLNEQFFTGLISGQQFRANSMRAVK
jgi:hypothetical protein